MAKKKVTETTTDPQLVVLDPQIELRRVFAWSSEIAKTLQQMNEDMIKLDNARIGLRAELEVLGRQAQEYREELTQLQRDVSRLKSDKFAITGIHG